MGESSSNTVPNVARALRIFELLAENNEGMLISQFPSIGKLVKSTAGNISAKLGYQNTTS